MTVEAWLAETVTGRPDKMVLIRVEQEGLLLNSRRDSFPPSLLPFLQLLLLNEDWERRVRRPSGEISTLPTTITFKISLSLTSSTKVN